MDTSKLLIPGPVIKVLDRVPSVPTAGIWNTLVRKAWLKVCSLLDKTGLPVTTMRGETLGVPLRSVAETRVYPTPRGAPVEKLAIPEICQLLTTARTGAMADLQAGGLYTHVSFTMCVRSKAARP